MVLLVSSSILKEYSHAISGHDMPTCSRATYEEDRFNAPIVEAGDSGNNLRMFNSSEYISTYGFAVLGCGELSTDCMPHWYATRIVLSSSGVLWMGSDSIVGWASSDFIRTLQDCCSCRIGHSNV